MTQGAIDKAEMAKALRDLGQDDSKARIDAIFEAQGEDELAFEDFLQVRRGPQGYFELVCFVAEISDHLTCFQLRTIVCSKDKFK